MGIFDFWRSREKQLDDERVSEELVREATDLVVKIANPRLNLVRRYRERLAPAVECSIHFLRKMNDSLPAAHEATAAGWAADPGIHAFFARPDDVVRAFSRSNEVRSFFERAPEQQEAFTLLGMAMTEQKVLGMQMQGEVIHRDVPQTTVSFSDYKMRVCGRTELELRRDLGRRLFEQFGVQALGRISAIQSVRRELEDKRALLKARLRLLQSQGAGLDAVFGDSAPAGDEKLRSVESQLEENERQLGESGSGADALDHELECVIDVLNNPGKGLVVTPRHLRLTSMNVIVEGQSSEPFQEVDFHVAEIASDPPMTRAFTLVRFPRADLLPSDFLMREAERYLG